MTEQNGIRILNVDYALSDISDIELADIMRTQCDVYNVAYREISTAILEVWAGIERIAEEIVRRKRNDMP